MSHHVLHILQHGCTLSRDRGYVVCRAEGQSDRTLPFEDIRAVIIAARGVTLTAGFLSALLGTDAVVLHCDERYQPIGITTPLSRVTNLQVFENQSKRPRRLNESLWHRMLRGKTVNQARVLRQRELHSAHLELALREDRFDEGNCARRYWQLYFPSIGWVSSSRDRKQENPPNQMLNYGYAVLSALCHRSLLIHGLLPQIGVHHKARYRSSPLVYDIMEPFRPIVDLLLAEFMVQPDVTMKDWAKKVGTELRERRVRHGNHTLKLMDAVDAAARALARSYAELSAEPFWVPVIE